MREMPEPINSVLLQEMFGMRKGFDERTYYVATPNSFSIDLRAKNVIDATDNNR